MNNDEKVKEMLEKEPVPQELEPENIKAMLDEKNAEKKRSGISVAGRLAAAAAACAVIGGGSYAYLKGVKPEKSHRDISTSSMAEETTTLPEVEQTMELYSQQAYMSGATDYSQIYELMKTASENQKKQRDQYRFTDDVKTFGAITDEEAVPAEAAEDFEDFAQEEAAEESYAADASAVQSVEDNAGGDYEFTEADKGEESEAFAEESSIGIEGIGGADGEEKPEFSDTYNQEKDVLEADIAKTDGKYIYYITSGINGEDGSLLRSAKVRDGKFLSSHTTSVDIQSFYEGADYCGSYVEDMYLYNDMVVIIGETFSEWYESDDYLYKQTTFAAFFTTGDSPELIDVYYQDGSYKDVRIAPDGNMYLLTNYTSDDYSAFDDPDDYDRYIPHCGLEGNCGLIPPKDILLPPEDDTRGITYVTYSIIGSVDLNESGSPRAVDKKALADYSGELYASADNFYTSVYHGDKTDITRIAIGGGGIAPAASATIVGFVKDQFSMSEYNGYFRVAVTRDTVEEGEKPRWWERLTDTKEARLYTEDTFKRDNALYVLDMDMNVVGSVEGFGETESVKSVSFQGDMAYVVTYEQTDPLFAIDLSDPTAPTILDEFKINGYSSYMQQWKDGLLLGFGVNADENAIETGIKMVMFDNSDPENLKEVGFWSLDRDDENGYSWVSSQAVWERKALLIAPEKNLIGFPVECEVEVNGNWKYENKFMFFSYEDGQFVEKGTIEAENNDYYDQFMVNRAMYIGDYVYVLSGARFIAADINDISITDDLIFSEGDRVEETTTAEVTEVTTEETTSVETTETTETSAETTAETTEEITTETTTAE